MTTKKLSKVELKKYLRGKCEQIFFKVKQKIQTDLSVCPPYDRTNHPYDKYYCLGLAHFGSSFAEECYKRGNYLTNAYQLSGGQCMINPKQFYKDLKLKRFLYRLIKKNSANKSLYFKYY